VRCSNGLPRLIEIPLVVVALVLLTPLLCLAALGIALTSPGPILYRQTRIGKGGRPFNIFKLRSMTCNSVGIGVTAGSDSRITSWGRLLRRAKIDELPQLWNVLKGDMRLVGPRPHMTQFVDLQNPLWQAVLAAAPGITDPTTLLLRNEERLLDAVETREGFYRDVLLPFKLQGYAEYLRCRTWRSDILVLARTVICVVIPSLAPAPSVEEVRRLAARQSGAARPGSTVRTQRTLRSRYPGGPPSGPLTGSRRVAASTDRR